MPRQSHQMHLASLVDEILARHALLHMRVDVNDPPSPEIWERHLGNELPPDELRAMTGLINALRRVAAGSYEKCVDCGQTIGALRLMEDPTTELCDACEADSYWRTGH